MIEKISAPISVLTKYSHKHKTSQPISLKWDGHIYKIKNVGFHHRYKKGTKLFHCYSVSSDELFFKITLNTEDLSWHLEEIADGLPN